MSLRSVAAAYLRAWTPLAGGAMLASWWGAWWWYARWSGGLGLAAMTAGVTVLGWLIGLRVPASERAAMDEWLKAGGAERPGSRTAAVNCGRAQRRT